MAITYNDKIGIIAAANQTMDSITLGNQSEESSIANNWSN